VDGSLVLQGDDPKHAATEFVDTPPETKSVMFLGLAVQGILDDPNAPFLLDVGTLPHNLVLEIVSEPVPSHSTLLLNSTAMFSGLTPALSELGGSRLPEGRNGDPNPP
jgi:hypothetical protein